MTETQPDYLKEARQMWVNNPSMHSPESTILGDILAHLEALQTPAQTPPVITRCSHTVWTLTAIEAKGGDGVIVQCECGALKQLPWGKRQERP